MSRRPQIIAGEKHNRLTAVRFSHMSERSERYWEFKCDCGKMHVASVAQVRYGGIRSCGCFFLERARDTRPGKHKMIHTPEYRVWQGMLRRCRFKQENPRHGGRGIAVCDRWRDFKNFYADMGPRPSRLHSIDRIDNDGNYEPANCRWATPKEQAINRRSTIFIEVNGEEMSLTDAASRLGVNYRTLYWRFKKNRPLVEMAR